jgi:hypothetical protein
MRLVTTCNAEGFERYAHRILEGWKYWPADTELWWYTEGFTIPNKPDGIVEISTDKLQGLQAFKLKHGKFRPPNYLFDVVRFSHKVYAAVDALSDYKGVGVWMDADCVTRKPIPPGFIENSLGRDYMAMFKRRGMYTETGFWIADCSHEQHREFLSTWVEWYDSGAFKDLANWTDCETLDATVRIFEKAGLIKTGSLSGEFEKEMHPMAKSVIGAYIDHTKGDRKDLGYSPEAQ